MKRQTTLAIFGILFAAGMALGTISVSGFSQPLFVASTDTKAVNHMDMMGHITITATDQDGTILSYIQTDNVIVNVGENCVAESMFNVTTNIDGVTQPCAGTGTQTGPNSNGVADGGFTYIAIGTGSIGIGSEGQTNSTLNTELDRIKDNSTSVNSAVGTGGDSAAVVTVSEVFTAAGISTVNESGIFDSKLTSGNNNMLARQVFTGIDLTAGDKLTVEWEIKIGS